MNRRWGKSRARLISRVLFGFGLALLLAGQTFAQDTKTVYVMPVDGVVDQIMEGYIRDGIAKAEREGATAVVIELDTPGGALDATREIRSRTGGQFSPIPPANTRVSIPPSAAM